MGMDHRRITTVVGKIRIQGKRKYGNWKNPEGETQRERDNQAGP